MSLRKLEPLGLVLALSYYFYHFWILHKNTVDLPRYDDFLLFSREWAKPFPSFIWLMDMVCEHRLSVHKLLHWFLHQMGVRYYASIQYISFFAYGLMGFSGWAILKLRKGPSEVAIWFVPFLFLPVFIENFTSPIVMSSHLAHLFFFWTAYFAFPKTPTLATHLATFAFAMLSIFSDVSGIPLVGVIPVFLIFFRGFNRQTLLSTFLLYLPIIIWVSISYFLLNKDSSTYRVGVDILGKTFWVFLFKTFGMVFGGYEQHLGIDNRISHLSNLIAVILVIVPFLSVSFSSRKSGRIGDQTTALLAGVLIAYLIGFSYARGVTEMGLLKRYFIYFVPLLPLVAALIYIWMDWRMERVKVAVLSLVFMLCAFNYRHGRHFNVYEVQREGREATLKCFQDAVKARADKVICTYYGEWDRFPLWKFDMAKNLYLSQLLGLSFMQGYDLSYLSHKWTDKDLDIIDQ